MQPLLIQLLNDSALYSLQIALKTARRIGTGMEFQKEMADLEMQVKVELDHRKRADGVDDVAF